MVNSMPGSIVKLRGRSTRFGGSGSVAKNTSKCAHCERPMNDYAGGTSRGYHNEMLCHPNAKNRPDCYRLVTIYKHPAPCDRKTCYENHPNFMDYVDGMEETIK